MNETCRISEFSKNSSIKYPLIQLADIFGGMHACSWRYKRSDSNRRNLQFEVIEKLIKEFNVSSNDGLEIITGKNNNPNFWYWKNSKESEAGYYEWLCNV